MHRTWRDSSESNKDLKSIRMFLCKKEILKAQKSGRGMEPYLWH
jgi:hypothetical protein